MAKENGITRLTSVVLRGTVLGLCLLPLIWTGASGAQCGGLIMTIKNTVPAIFAGDNHTLQCLCNLGDISGPQTELVWLRDNTEIGRSPIPAEGCTPNFPFEYNLTPAQLTDNGGYVCQVETNSIVQNASCPLTLNVLDPAIIQAPPEQYALVNSDVTLNCSTTISDISLWSTQWFNMTTGQKELIGRRLKISPVSVYHEGLYICEISIAVEGISQSIKQARNVRFLVVVPPTITSHPEPHKDLVGNRLHVFTVDYQSRLSDTTTVTWFKDDTLIPMTNLESTISGVGGTTTLTFDPARRNDSGVYRVEVVNNFHLIPEDLRKAESSFQLTVYAPPATPANLQYVNLSPLSTRVTWSLTHRTTDDAAERLEVYVICPDQSVDRRHVIPGDQTQYTLAVVPGADYTVTVTAINQDGASVSFPTRFQAMSAAPAIYQLEVTRVNTTMFVVSVTLNYTGGGRITHFTVSFREHGTTEWFDVEPIPAQQRAESDLAWNGIISHEGFDERGPMEFRVGVNNQVDMASSWHTKETLIPPGPPTSVTLTSSSTSSLAVQVQLSDEGSFPITGVVITIVGPSRTTVVNASGWYHPGQLVTVSVPGLKEGTDYQLQAYEVNYAGRGPPGDSVSATTESEDNSMPAWVITVIAVTVSLAMVIVIIAALIVALRCHRVRRGKRIHQVTNPAALSAEEKPLDSNHEMINHRGKSAFPSIGGVSLTPRESTPVSNILSPMGTVSLPSDNGVPSPEYHHNHDNDYSDSNCPRYTYWVTPRSPAQSLPSLQTHPTIPTSVTTIHSSSHSAGSLHASSIHSSSHNSIITCPPAPVSNATEV